MPKPKTENTKKAAGNAKKAAVAAEKASVASAAREKAESAQWAKGAKDTSKADAAADKAAEAQRKKAEKAKLLAEEEKSLPAKPVKKGGAAPKGGSAAKKDGSSRGLDLSQLEGGATAPLNKKKGSEDGGGVLSASNIDDAITALSLTQGTGSADKIDRHPERRFKAAYTVFEERRLEEMKDEKGLRRQQKIDQIRKEFEKSSENPYNQGLVGRYDMDKDEARELRDEKRKEVEGRLGTGG